MKHRVNLITAVNAKNVSKVDGRYYVKDVVHALDGIVLNSRMYPGDELAKSAPTLEGKPAPAGHPKDSKGRHISASNGAALSAAWVGAWCTNSRYEAGKALCDIEINEAQAKAMPAGAEIIARLDAAIAGTNVEPISVSSGLMLREIAANGESRGKKYRAIATDMQFDHVAFLLNEKPAGTPEEGIGVFVNEAGEEDQVETVEVNTDPEDRRTKGLLQWIANLLGRKELPADMVANTLGAELTEGAWLREIGDKSAVWIDTNGDAWEQAYKVNSDGSLSFSASPVKVVARRVEYEPLKPTGDAVKETILAALNASGSQVAGLDDAQLLAVYNAMILKPAEDKLTAANAKVAAFEANAAAAAEAEVTALATELATNSRLTVEDLKKLGADRLREIKATAGAKAAPVLLAKAGEKTSTMAGYSLNSHLE